MKIKNKVGRSGAAKKRSRPIRSDRHPGSDANLESFARDVMARAYEGSAFPASVYVTVDHVRGRLADLDNLSIKAVLDAVVETGILADDSPEWTKEITHTQDKGKPERTIVTIRTRR